MRSFLVIGLGGSGGKTIRYLKQSLGEWLNEIGWASGMPQGWQFLHIDTPSTQESPILPGRPSCCLRSSTCRCIGTACPSGPWSTG